MDRSNPSTRGNPDPKVKKLTENEHEIPSFYAVRCFDVALNRGFRAVRRAKVLRGSFAIRSAEVLHHHETPGGRVGRTRHRPGGSGDDRWQAAPRLDARDLAGKHARARASDRRNAVGSDKVRSSGHDALRGRRPAHAGSLSVSYTHLTLP